MKDSDRTALFLLIYVVIFGALVKPSFGFHGGGKISNAGMCPMLLMRDDILVFDICICKEGQSSRIIGRKVVFIDCCGGYVKNSFTMKIRNQQRSAWRFYNPRITYVVRRLSCREFIHCISTRHSKRNLGGPSSAIYDFHGYGRRLSVWKILGSQRNPNPGSVKIESMGISHFSSSRQAGCLSNALIERAGLEIQIVDGVANATIDARSAPRETFGGIVHTVSRNEKLRGLLRSAAVVEDGNCQLNTGKSCYRGSEQQFDVPICVGGPKLMPAFAGTSLLILDFGFMCAAF